MAECQIAEADWQQSRIARAFNKKVKSMNLKKGIWFSKTTELPSTTLGISSDLIGLVLTSSSLSGRVELSFLWT
ncbi:hypothetical protein ACSBR2_014842 [Camellia fascicularis]